jgi:hypothetical protein
VGAGTMKQALSITLQQAAKTTYYIVSRIAGFVALGLVVNIVLVALLWPEFNVISQQYQGAQPLIRVLIVILLSGVFLLGWSALYFLLGQKHGILAALRYILAENKFFVTEYLVSKLLERIHAMPVWLEKINQSGVRKALNEILPIYLAKLDNMSWALRKLFRLLIEQIDVQGIVSAVIEEQQLTELDVPKLNKGIAVRINALMEDIFLTPNWQWLLILIVSNIGVFGALKYYL